MITTIKRSKKKEIDIAVNDLLERGFTLVYGPVEQKADTTIRRNYKYRFTNTWVAKLEIEDKQRQGLTRNDKEVAE